MKKVVLIVFTLACILLSGCSSDVKSDEGVSHIFEETTSEIIFAEASWDDSIEDLVQLHGDYTEKYDSTYGGLGYVFSDIEFEGEIGVLRYFFNENNVLVASEFHLGTNEKEHSEDAYSAFLNTLIDTYGESNKATTEKDGFKSELWYRDSGNISLSFISIDTELLKSFQIKVTFLNSMISITEDEAIENEAEQQTLNEQKIVAEENYIKNEVELVDFIVEECTGYKGDVPGIRNISIKNNGDKVIDSLQITLDFLSDNSQIVDSKTVTVIGMFDEGIKPGYSWGMEDDKFFEIEDLNENVILSKVNVTVSSVDLSELDKSTILSEEDEYMYTNLELLDYKVDIFSSYKGKVPGIADVSIKNNGDRNIETVTVTVFFQNQDGQDIAEDSFMVIGNIFDGSNILKSNYSWKMENGKFYQIENLADEVDVSRHRVEITEIEFE